MKRLRSVLLPVLAATAAVALAGCVQKQPMYAWGSYDASMYQYAKDSTKQSEFREALAGIIAASQSAGKPVPPGIHAEYGYQLLEMGKTDEAIAAFNAEKAAWPESTQFMESMITYARAGRSQKPAAAQTSQILQEPAR